MQLLEDYLQLMQLQELKWTDRTVHMILLPVLERFDEKLLEETKGRAEVLKSSKLDRKIKDVLVGSVQEQSDKTELYGAIVDYHGYVVVLMLEDGDYNMALKGKAKVIHVDIVIAILGKLSAGKLGLRYFRIIEDGDFALPGGAASLRRLPKGSMMASLRPVKSRRPSSGAKSKVTFAKVGKSKIRENKPNGNNAIQRMIDNYLFGKSHKQMDKTSKAAPPKRGKGEEEFFSPYPDKEK